MQNSFREQNKSRKTREEVSRGSTVDKVFRCSWDDLNIVLNDWKKIKPDLNKLGLNIFQRFLTEHLSYKELFPSFASVPQENLLFNEDFKVHSYAVMQSLNSIMKNLSAEYEDDNEILPAIGVIHQKRGITLSMMNQLKECILLTLTEVLQSDKREKAAWKTVLNFIFEDNLFKAYFPKEELENVDN